MSERDLSMRMDKEYEEEFMTIRDALNRALDNLDEGLSQVAVSSDQISSASGQISDGSQSLAQGATQQASTLEEVASRSRRNHLDVQAEYGQRAAGARHV